MQENGLIRKIKVNFKIYESQPRNKTIAIHILSNISRSEDNKTIKFGQLIEYNMGNVFLEKWYSKYGRETIPRPFSKKSKLNVSVDH